jgi:microcystin-dependent protein
MSISLREASLSITPTGCIIAFAGSSAPDGWVVCNGAQLYVGDFADLYNVIGTTYNIPSTVAGYFSIPDIRGRVIAGMGGATANRLTGQSGGVNGDTLGGVGGAQTHRLTISEMPSHSHSLTNGVGTKSNSFDSGTLVASDGGGSTGYTGFGNVHNNVQPTMILNYIIKT